MKRVVTAVAGNEVVASDINTVQDQAEGAVPASKNNDFGAAADTRGTDVVRWQCAAAWNNAKVRQIDAGIDWRDRVLEVLYVELGADNVRIGQALDYSNWQALTQTRVAGYTGTGAYSNVAGAGTAVSDGNPPVQATGGVTSYAVKLTAGVVWLYADPTDGSLWGYNQTGAPIYPYLEIRGTGDTGKH